MSSESGDLSLPVTPSADSDWQAAALPLGLLDPSVVGPRAPAAVASSPQASVDSSPPPALVDAQQELAPVKLGGDDDYLVGGGLPEAYLFDGGDTLLLPDRVDDPFDGPQQPTAFVVLTDSAFWGDS